MQTFLFYLAATNLTVMVCIALRLAFAARHMRRLGDVELNEAGDNAHQALPLVSLIVAARNEERHIEAGVRSMLRLEYPHLEFTVVNDRSTDRTGEILDRLAQEESRLNIVHVTDLPRGWLGKNHAMQFGADRSHGEWLLFTDADIFFEASVLRRALRYIEQQQLDHLAIAPKTTMPTWLLESFVVTLIFFFSILIRPWKVRDPKSTAHVGIGAFNMVRADVYRKLGGHAPLAMRPDDDLKLGKLIKINGYRQDVLDGGELLEVPWYGSLRELIVGLEKNTFAVVEYSVITLLASVGAILVGDVWPFVAPFFTTGATRWMYVATAGIFWGLCLAIAHSIKVRWTCALAFPLVALLFCYIQLRAMFLCLKNDGIRWRDTHYSLAELRANKV